MRILACANYAAEREGFSAVHLSTRSLLRPALLLQRAFHPHCIATVPDIQLHDIPAGNPTGTGYLCPSAPF